ncbi:hypothetical protein XaC1_12 [Xanthomonas phage XaC1]|nr:hypothetical protein XaC1_12 [Xanthomonas phage XaC1]
MQVNLHATSFRLRDDTESLKETVGLVKFLEDHKVPFTRYTTPKTLQSGITFPEEKRVQWHENDRAVEIPCSTIEELQKYCKDYDCTFIVHDEYIQVTFP